MDQVLLFHLLAFITLCLVGLGTIVFILLDRRDVSWEDFAILGLLVFLILAQGLDLFFYEERIEAEAIPLPATVIEAMFQFAIALMVLIILITHRQARESARKLDQKNRELQEANREINVLLKEVHHRVRNNLQTIVSLLSLESREARQPEIKRALNRSKQRIRSISMVHQLLHESDRLADLSLNEYIKKIVDVLTDELSEAKNVNAQLSVPSDLTFEMDTMITLGLVLNELVSNALEHAFDEDGGTVYVRVAGNGNRCVLEVRDDGRGFPKDPDTKPDSLGLSLVRRLVQNTLQGTLDVQSENGTRVRIAFSLPPDDSSPNPA